MDPVISINTLAYEGYDLTTALEEISKIGADYVELGFTKGFTEGLTEAYFSEAFAQETGKRIFDLGLSCIALSAHTDLSTEASIDELKRRLEFGKRLGVKIVNTKVGPKSRRD
ncbi:MAG: sugar phosphate isomerase/epimerase [Deltaproteobacteria bacterium]|nr:sugar phosphate isomerase/epimerase [Deltaproteobacteria bacterium]